MTTLSELLIVLAVVWRSNARLTSHMFLFVTGKSFLFLPLPHDLPGSVQNYAYKLRARAAFFLMLKLLQRQFMWRECGNLIGMIGQERGEKIYGGLGVCIRRGWGGGGGGC